jgi:hypothetical protein
MTDITVRMSLVEERYESLEKRMTSVENKVDLLREDMHNGQKAMIKTIYTVLALFSGFTITAFGIIVNLIQ